MACSMQNSKISRSSGSAGPESSWTQWHRWGVDSTGWLMWKEVGMCWAIGSSCVSWARSCPWKLCQWVGSCTEASFWGYVWWAEGLSLTGAFLVPQDCRPGPPSLMGWQGPLQCELNLLSCLCGVGWVNENAVISCLFLKTHYHTCSHTTPSIKVTSKCSVFQLACSTGSNRSGLEPLKSGRVMLLNLILCSVHSVHEFHKNLWARQPGLDWLEGRALSQQRAFELCFVHKIFHNRFPFFILLKFLNWAAQNVTVVNNFLLLC